MNLLFSGKQISGILTVLPEDERLFTDEMERFGFPISRSMKLKEVMGYDKHRIVSDGTCVSDLAVSGIRHLFEVSYLRPDEIDALVVVTQTPDYILPPTSFVVHGELNLKQSVFCLDINQGCAGFLIGLFQAFMLLEQSSIKKVVLINGDVLSTRVSPQDRNSFPLIGDAVAITIVERSKDADPIHAIMKSDGGRREALMIPAGGARFPCTESTKHYVDNGDGNLRSLEHLRMDGTAVFNFVQTAVPPMIDELLEWSGNSKESIDYFLFHQPNRFMLQKLADRLDIPHNKVPMNVVEKFGNSSGATIPVAIAENLTSTIVNQKLSVVMAGFGVGLTWASLKMNLGNLDFCEKLYHGSKD